MGLMMVRSSLSDSLPVNHAGFKIINNSASTAVSLWGQAIDCYLCDLIKLVAEPNETEPFWKFDANTKWNLELRDDANNSTLCRYDQVSFVEHGVYRCNYTNSSSCLPIETEYKPRNPLFPIFIFEGLLVLFVCLKALYKTVNENRAFFLGRYGTDSTTVLPESDTDLTSPEDANKVITRSASSSTVQLKETKTHRIRSLDIFRGLTISLMIFVNYGGGQYWFFEHAPWNGVTMADVVFPWFAWIMGVSIALKVKSELRKSVPKSTLIRNISIRSVTLVLLGVILTNWGHNNLATFRLPGVLQRLGISYFIVALLETAFMKPQPQLEDSRYKMIEDLVESWKQWLIVFACVLVHTCLTFYLPVPNCPTGYLGPGGLHNHSSAPNCTGGAAGYIDRLIFTEKHLYARPTCRQYYDCKMAYDPEGLLGVLTMVFCVYLGVHAGRILLVYKSANERLLRWIVWFVVTIIAAGFLCDFSVNEGFIPLNKNLWSLSYVLFCSSAAFLHHIVLYFVFDKKKWISGSTLSMVGMNAILLYIGQDICYQTFPWQWVPLFNASTHTEYFVMDVWATILFTLIAIYLGKREIFFTI